MSEDKIKEISSHLIDQVAEQAKVNIERALKSGALDLSDKEMTEAIMARIIARACLNNGIENIWLTPKQKTIMKNLTLFI